MIVQLCWKPLLSGHGTGCKTGEPELFLLEKIAGSHGEITWATSCHQALRQMVPADRQWIEAAHQPSPSLSVPPFLLLPHKHTQIAFLFLLISPSYPTKLFFIIVSSPIYFFLLSHTSFYSSFQSTFPSLVFTPPELMSIWVGKSTTGGEDYCLCVLATSSSSLLSYSFRSILKSL